LIGWLIAGLSLFMKGNTMTYNIDTMTLAEMIAFYNALPIEERPNHWLLKLHIETLI
jgi:hypothetical protein